MNLAKVSATDNLADFQQAFGQYLREQKKDSQPQDNNNEHIITTVTETKNFASQVADIQSMAKISNRVGELYQSLVFNNIRGFLDRCFPVCQTLISKDKWNEICQLFFLTYACHSPYFTEINQSFVDFLAQPNKLEQLELPPYFAELAHYEWVELMVDTHCLDKLTLDQDTFASPASVIEASLVSEPAIIAINPSVQNLHYQWPVHLINADNLVDEPEDSFFLVYRDLQNEVQFMHVNALTHALIDFIANMNASIGSSINEPILDTTEALTQLLQRFSKTLGYEDHDILVTFGLPLLDQLKQQQVLYTVHQSIKP